MNNFLLLDIMVLFIHVFFFPSFSPSACFSFVASVNLSSLSNHCFSFKTSLLYCCFCYFFFSSLLIFTLSSVFYLGIIFCLFSLRFVSLWYTIYTVYSHSNAHRASIYSHRCEMLLIQFHFGLFDVIIFTVRTNPGSVMNLIFFFALVVHLHFSRSE